MEWRRRRGEREEVGRRRRGEREEVGRRREEGGRVERKRHRIERGGVGDSGVIVQFDTCILL